MVIWESDKEVAIETLPRPMGSRAQRAPSFREDGRSQRCWRTLRVRTRYIVSVRVAACIIGRSLW
jgi:hypothetical protein